MHDVNVVIVNYRCKDQVLKCLESLFSHAQKCDLDVHVCVVDNNSDDLIESPLLNTYSDQQLRLIKNRKNYGFAKAQNIGINKVKAKYHFILNPDTVFLADNDVIRKLYDFMEKSSNVGIAGPKLIYPDGGRQNSCYRFPKFLQPLYSRTKLGEIGLGRKTAHEYFMKDFDHDQTIPVDWVMGAAMFVRGSAIEEVGQFDERFWMYAEDSDWCRRMWEEGWHVFYVHDAVIRHEHKRGSAGKSGIFKSIITNKLTRAHLKSWLQYMWKWRKNHKYYA